MKFADGDVGELTRLVRGDGYNQEKPGRKAVVALNGSLVVVFFIVLTISHYCIAIAGICSVTATLTPVVYMLAARKRRSNCSHRCTSSTS